MEDEILHGGLFKPEMAKRYVDLLKKNAEVFAEHPPRFFCMRCNAELEVVGRDEDGRQIFADHECPNPGPTGSLDHLFKPERE